MARAQFLIELEMVQSVRVFVVEDDGLILVNLEAALCDGGFQTTSAMSGLEAITLIDD